MKIDLNCDMGEGCDGDGDLMGLVSSANIACGFHAGDIATMQMTVESAIKNGVAIGAHPSFRDREGFGRRPMNVPPAEVFDIVAEQINRLREICISCGVNMGHVKPHGALYNQSARDADLARAIAGAVSSVDDNLILFGLSGSELISEGEKGGLRTASEVFADRTYQSDGSLTPRTKPNALISDPQMAVRQVLDMIDRNVVITPDGIEVPIKAETICIHGDGENAVDFARMIRLGLTRAGIGIRAV